MDDNPISHTRVYRKTTDTLHKRFVDLRPLLNGMIWISHMMHDVYIVNCINIENIISKEVG